MNKNLILAFFCLTFIALSCQNDDAEPEGPSSETFEATANINPNNFPLGIALELTKGDTGRLVQLDEVQNAVWDINVITYRTANGGRPGVILFGDSRNSAAATQAVNVSEGFGIGTGLSGFDGFTQVSTAMQNGLSADDEFLFDPQLDVDQNGRADEDILRAAYQDLVIGDRIVNLETASQPVYLVRSRDGILFKFQLVSRAQGGAATLRWARFANSAID